MKRHLRAAKHACRDDRERGAATIESVGMYVVAGILATGLVLTAVSASPVVHDKFRQAICILTSLGQGPCESANAEADKHKPTEPCVISAEGHTGIVEVSLGVSAAKNEQFLVEHLNNGKIRVTRGTGAKVGVGVARGANISVTVNDKVYGGAAKADAGVSANFADGESYYVDNAKDAANLLAGHQRDTITDSIFGSKGPVRGVVDAVLGKALPKADETFTEAGVAADAKALATGKLGTAQAGVGVHALLGERKGRDGTSTAYYQLGVDLNISAAGWLGNEPGGQPDVAKAGVQGQAESVVEVERDAKGFVTAVRNRRLLAGTAQATLKASTDKPASTYQEEVIELPTTSSTDQVIAQRFLSAMGLDATSGFKNVPQGQGATTPLGSAVEALNATGAFAQAAGRRGISTKQGFNDSKSSSNSGVFDAGDLVKFGGNITFDKVDRSSTGAEYFNGKSWAPLEGCGGK